MSLSLFLAADEEQAEEQAEAEAEAWDVMEEKVSVGRKENLELTPNSECTACSDSSKAPPRLYHRKHQKEILNKGV